MKIKILEIASWQEKYLLEKLSGNEVTVSAMPLVESNEVDNSTEILVPFVGSRLNAENLAKFPNLKAIVTRSTGYDHIDLEYSKTNQITVCNVPSYGENTVAEFAFALILTLSRKMYPSIKRVREQGRFDFSGFAGFDLLGRTIGIVGLGRIGVHVARIAKGFGMKIYAYDLYPREDVVSELGVKYVGIEELLSNSDIVSLHMPYTPENHHFMNDQRFDLMKQGSIIINTARGALIETESLIRALESGKLIGAGLDVLEDEVLIKDEISHLLEGHPDANRMRLLFAESKLMWMDNVIITPHNAFQTKEAIERILDTTAANIQAIIEGSPKNVI